MPNGREHVLQSRCQIANVLQGLKAADQIEFLPPLDNPVQVDSLKFYVGMDRLSLIDQVWQIVEAMDFATANLTQDVCDVAVAATDVRYGRRFVESRNFPDQLPQSGPVMAVPQTLRPIGRCVIDHYGDQCWIMTFSTYFSKACKWHNTSLSSRLEGRS
jgi:hypothetical protein